LLLHLVGCLVIVSLRALAGFLIELNASPKQASTRATNKATCFQPSATLLPGKGIQNIKRNRKASRDSVLAL
jgi:hypothetical protein